MITPNDVAQRIQTVHHLCKPAEEWGGLTEALRLMSEPNTPQDEAEFVLALEQLEPLVAHLGSATEDDYRAAKLLWSMASAMDCSAFNRHIKGPIAERITALLLEAQKRAVRYVRSQVSTGDLNWVSRYAVNPRWYRDEDLGAVLAWLNERGVLRRQVAGLDPGRLSLWVVGLRAKVGDNVFTVDRYGREHRQYVGVVSLQAFPVSRNVSSIPADFVATIPALDESLYTQTYFGDGKNLARPPALRWGKLNEVVHRLGFVRGLFD